MKKPASLRAALVAALPSLASTPDLLLVFINEGRIVSTGSRTASFDYEYECEIIIKQFAPGADPVMVAVLEWAKVNEPALLENPDLRRDGISFVADILSNDAVDLALKLKLSESVLVRVDDAGRRIIKHLDEPTEVL